MSARLVLLAGPGASTHIVFHALDQAIGVDRVILEARVPRRTIFARRARRHGVQRAVGQALFQLTVAPWLQTRSEERIEAIVARAGMNPTALDPSRTTRVDSVNSAVCIAELERLAPKLVVLNGTRVVSERVLDAGNARFLNLHAGITPAYRGVHGAYWALVEDRLDLCGVTVHVVDRGIDTGPVLAQARIEPEPTDNYATYPYLQLEAGLPALLACVRRALEGTLAPTPPWTSTSKLHSHPTLGEYLRHRVLRGVR